MHPYGACFHDLEEKMSTGVIEFLKSRGIENIIAGGLATDYCVKNTAIQLRKAGFNVIVNLEACRGIADDTILSAIDEMKKSGITVTDRLEPL
jgi:nicotinamidase/pyrazinamidase